MIKTVEVKCTKKEFENIITLTDDWGCIHDRTGKYEHGNIVMFVEEPTQRYIIFMAFQNKECVTLKPKLIMGCKI